MKLERFAEPIGYGLGLGTLTMRLAMSDKPFSRTAKSDRTAIRRFTLALPPLLWCFGFVTSLLAGCSAPEALLKATAYMLSGFGGWIVYLLVRSPSDLLFAPVLLTGINVTMLNPTRTPWPFPQMLAHGLFTSVLCMLIAGLVGRWLERAKSGRPSGVHPLSDAEVDQPLSGR
jgi:hypothetical protein